MESTFFQTKSQDDRPRRATLRLLEPTLQLRLPAYLIGVTTVFAFAATLHSWFAYERILTGIAAAEGHRELLGSQTADFITVSLVMLVAYGLVVAAVCVSYLRGVVGPLVAFRRQIEALRRGDYTARNQLREGAPFAELSQDLNELAQALEVRREMRLLNH